MSSTSSRHKDSNIVKKLMARIAPIDCSWTRKEKKGLFCPTRQNLEVCCWYCELLSRCVKRWPPNKYHTDKRKDDDYCPRYKVSKWCSAVLKARHEMEGKNVYEE